MKVTINEEGEHVFVSGAAHSGKTTKLLEMCMESNVYINATNAFICIEETSISVLERMWEYKNEQEEQGNEVNLPLVTEISTLQEIIDLIELGQHNNFYIDGLAYLPYKGTFNIFERVIEVLDKHNCKGYFTMQTSRTTF